MNKSKYKRLVDLYVTGVEYVFPDGTPAWLQVLNPFERDSVRKEAQIARARLLFAMKEHGSDEQARVKAAFYAEGRDRVIDQLAEIEVSAGLSKVIDAIHSDEDWAKKLEILERGDDDAQLSTEEEQLLVKIQADYIAEIGSRADTEREFLKTKYGQYEEDALWEAYLESWLERLGDDVAMETFKAGQVAYGARVCEGVKTEEGWDHSACEGHQERIWDSLTEVRALPDSLFQGLMDTLDTVEMTDRQAKNSDRQMSSSGSSQLPSEEEASTASTPTETPDAPRGTSSQPSPTPSPSSDGSNSPTTTNPPSVSG